MIYRAIVTLFLAASTAFAAQEVQIGCQQLRIVLDKRLSPDVVERDWGSGNPHDEDPASLELLGCDGTLLSVMRLDAPLATIDPDPVKGTAQPTVLVSADLTAEAGSYNGPLTIPVEIVNERLVPATARTTGGGAVPIRLALTGKSAWKRLPAAAGRSEELLYVASRPSAKGHGFVTEYRRYSVASRGWWVKTKFKNGLWESDGAFPPSRMFP